MNEQQKQADELLEQVLGILGDAHELVQISVAIRTLTIIVGFALDMSEVECAAFAAEFSDVLTRLPKNRSTNLLNSTEKVYTTEQQKLADELLDKVLGIVGDANDPVQISVAIRALTISIGCALDMSDPECTSFAMDLFNVLNRHPKKHSMTNLAALLGSTIVPLPEERRPSEFYRVLNRSTN